MNIRKQSRFKDLALGLACKTLGFEPPLDVLPGLQPECSAQLL